MDVGPSVSLLVSSLVAIGAALGATRLGARWARKDAAAERAIERAERERERREERRQRSLLDLLDALHGPAAEQRFALGVRMNELASIRLPLGRSENDLVPVTHPAVLAAANAAGASLAEVSNYLRVALRARAQLIGDEQVVRLTEAFIGEAFDEAKAAFEQAMRGHQTKEIVGDAAAQQMSAWLIEHMKC